MNWTHEEISRWHDRDYTDTLDFIRSLFYNGSLYHFSEITYTDNLEYQVHFDWQNNPFLIILHHVTITNVHDYNHVRDFEYDEFPKFYIIN